MECLIRKDSVSFAQLFLHDSIPWIGIREQKSLTLIREKQAGAISIFKGSWHDFIHFVVHQPALIEEKFFHTVINADGVLASVTFDYSFWKGRQPANWVKGSWLVVKDGDKWKIASVYYSVVLDQVEKTPTFLR